MGRNRFRLSSRPATLGRPIHHGGGANCNGGEHMARGGDCRQSRWRAPSRAAERGRRSRRPTVRRSDKSSSSPRTSGVRSGTIGPWCPGPAAWGVAGGTSFRGATTEHEPFAVGRSAGARQRRHWHRANISVPHRPPVVGAQGQIGERAVIPVLACAPVSPSDLGAVVQQWSGLADDPQAPRCLSSRLRRAVPAESSTGLRQFRRRPDRGEATLARLFVVRQEVARITSIFRDVGSRCWGQTIVLPPNHCNSSTLPGSGDTHAGP